MNLGSKKRGCAEVLKKRLCRVRYLIVNLFVARKIKNIYDTVKLGNGSRAQPRDLFEKFHAEVFNYPAACLRFL